MSSSATTIAFPYGVKGGSFGEGIEVHVSNYLEHGSHRMNSGTAETGLNFLISTQDKIRPGERARSINRAQKKRP